MIYRGRATDAISHDGEVMVASMESVLVAQVVEHRLDFFGGYERRLSADLAHEMLMVVLHGEVPTSRLVPEMDMMNQPDPRQIVECSIRSRGIDRNTMCLDSAEDLLGGEKPLVVARKHCADRSTRHRQPQTRVTNPLVNGVLEIGSDLTHRSATIAPADLLQ